jgi:flavodoxin
MPKILIVFYSRTGTTRRIAEAIRARCNADIEEIRDARPRDGLFRGWWRSIREARRGSETQILPTTKRVDDYDLVVLGTPVWASSMSSPLRTWLNSHRHEIRRVAIFATQGGSGGERALTAVAKLCALAPVARLVVNAGDVNSGACEAELERFVARLAIAEPIGAGT